MTNFVLFVCFIVILAILVVLLAKQILEYRRTSGYIQVLREEIERNRRERK